MTNDKITAIDAIQAKECNHCYDYYRELDSTSNQSQMFCSIECEKAELQDLESHLAYGVDQQEKEQHADKIGLGAGITAQQLIDNAMKGR